MDTNSADDPRTEGVSAENSRLSVSPQTVGGYASRPATDEPQTADQRLPLFVVLLASFFLLGVGAGWGPGEPGEHALSPQVVLEAQTVDATEVTSTDTTELPEAPTTP